MSKLIQLKSYLVPGTNGVSFDFHPTWHDWLMEEGLLGDDFKKLILFLVSEQSHETLLPDMHLWFSAFQDDPKSILVVLMGQDPYPKRKMVNDVMKNMATGYSFDIAHEFNSTASMRTVFDSIERQYGKGNVRINRSTANLRLWIEQGVFLLNAALTIGAKKARPMKTKPSETRVRERSYVDKWQFFIEGVIRILCRKRPFLVFIFWGNYAAELEPIITWANQYYQRSHKVLKSYHPSTLGEREGAKAIRSSLALGQQPKMNVFSEEDHFLEVNHFLEKHYPKFTPIDWSTLPKP